MDGSGMDGPDAVDRTASWRAPALAVAALTAVVLVVLPHRATQLGPTTSFVPAVLALVAAVDLLTCYLLVREFAERGDRRLLAMAGAYLASLVVMAGYAGAFPGVLSAVPPLQTAPSVTPWLYVLWHVGFPVALGLAWAPWPARLVAPCEQSRRRRSTARLLLCCAAGAGALVALVVAAGAALPVLIHGTDTSRMTALTAPVGLPLVALALAVTVAGLRSRRGPERWTVVTVWVCLADLLLTYGSHFRYSVGWYTGRTLTVVAAAVVLLAMLHDVARLQARLRDTLEHTASLAALHRTVLDSLSEAVVLQDATGLLSANASAIALLRLEPDELSSAEFDVVHEDGTPWPREDRPSQVALRTGLPCRDVLMGVDLPQGRRWMSVNATPLRRPDGTAHQVVTSFSDVTARERDRAELQASRDAALQTVAVKSAFLASVSHEIRTPLNGLLGLTDLLLLSPLDEEQRRLAGTAKQCGRALLALLNDVLDLSKVEAGELQLEHLPLSPADTVREAVAIVAPGAAAKGLRLDVVVAPDLPPQVRGDALRLRQMVTNLLSNAVKFTAVGGVTVHLACRDGALRVAVQDTGVGLPAEGADRLFEPYQQGPASTARDYGGTGLGLAIVRDLARRMGGDVGAEPAPGGGALFWFTVRLEVQRTAVPVPVPRAPEALAALRGRVLVAEDNAVNALVAQLLLEGWGLEVVGVPDGAAAVAAVARDRFDVVLMDAQMPVLGGVEATVALRAAHRTDAPPVLALSASALHEDRAAFLAAGAVGYLTKPIVDTDLHAALARVLAGTRLPLPTGPA